jgi:hypothetical protein
MRDLTRFTVLDAAFVAALVAVPVVALTVRGRASGREPVVEVIRDNRLVGRYPLDRDRAIDAGTDVKVEIRAGRVRVLEADCPRGVCMRAGWQGRPGRSIVCVPNRVVVTIKGAYPGYDAETH